MTSMANHKPNRLYNRPLNARLLLLILGLCVFVCLFTAKAMAQAPSVQAEASEASTNEQAQQPESQLDDSTEAPQAQPADTEDQGADLGLGELIDTAVLSEDWAQSLNATLNRYGLSSSSLGQIVATFLVLLAFLVFYFVLKKIAHNLVSRLKSANNPIRLSFKRMKLYLTFVNIMIFLLLVCLLLMTLSGVWSSEADSTFVFIKASEAFQFIATLAFLSTLGALAFETISVIIERLFSRWSDHSSARVQTLLPIAKTVINATLFIILGITLISELGINVMPLLAGAGVVGFAVGFGAQTLVKDLITGFIIIFEDLLQVGDVVSVGGKSGLIERITIRKIQLRGLDGTVTTVPFGEITIVDNMTKDYSYCLMDVKVAYRESTDEVVEVLKSIAAEMQSEDAFKSIIIAPIEILGVDALAESWAIIKARIKTTPINQWTVGREFNRRLKYRLDEMDIEIPLPHQRLYFGEGKNGKAPPVRIQVDEVTPVNDDQGAINTKKNPAHKIEDGGYIEDDGGTES